MMRQPSSKKQRNKGFRVRHALQIGLLIAVCLWLLYQVKHSHETKLSMEEEKSGLTRKVAETNKEVFNLGRKDLPQREEVGLSHDTQDGELEKEEIEEEEEKDGNKQEEAEEEDGGVAADDEIDEQDHEKGEEEEAGEELDGEEEKEIRDGESYLFEDPEDHDRAAQKAREENYKRDDVSGSVHRETQATEVEGSNEDVNASKEEHVENVDKEDIVIQNMGNEKSGVSADGNA